MKRVILVLCLGMLGGCAVVPETITKQPATAHPAPQVAAGDGSIYHAGTYRPMFVDWRPVMVGDVITILISETNDASKTASSSGSKTGSVSAGIPTVVGLPLKTLQGTNLAASTSNKAATTDVLNSANTFTSTLAVTVTAVRPNGDLEVSGEKQVALDSGVEYIRFSGVVNPAMIQTGNVVSSTQVAEARIEYRSDSRIDKASLMSAMSRFFQSMAPF